MNCRVNQSIVAEIIELWICAACRLLMTKRRRNGIDCDAIGIYWSFIATCAVHYIDGAVLVTKQRIDKRSDRERGTLVQSQVNGDRNCTFPDG